MNFLIYFLVMATYIHSVIVFSLIKGEMWSQYLQFIIYFELDWWMHNQSKTFVRCLTLMVQHKIFSK